MQSLALTLAPALLGTRARGGSLDNADAAAEAAAFTQGRPHSPPLSLPSAGVGAAAAAAAAALGARAVVGQVLWLRLIPRLSSVAAAKGREEGLQGDSEVLVEKDLTRLKGVGLAPSREPPAFWSGPAPATVALT